ncbi:MAG: hypothetical protein HC888_11140 [Candidatus Competibacteraceae bacterium]|nr:hypothetical protein [Candidatus Competibacteraceae bacterium]
MCEANNFIVYEPFFRGIPLNSPLLVETPFSAVNLQLDIDCDIHSDLCAAKQEIEEAITAELANSGITGTSEPQSINLPSNARRINPISGNWCSGKRKNTHDGKESFQAPIEPQT